MYLVTAILVPSFVKILVSMKQLGMLPILSKIKKSMIKESYIPTSSATKSRLSSTLLIVQ